jgi:hypothetical protein
MNEVIERIYESLSFTIHSAIIYSQDSKQRY